MMRIGFIGIGKMGWPMARRLSEAGYDVCVSDAVPGRAADFAACHAARTGDPARDAEVLITMLPTSREVGGVARAEDGTLAIMTGGDAAVLDRVAPVLRAMGGTITRCGDVGAGQAMKALNNLVSAAGFLIGVEALLVGQKFGLDPATMVDVLNASTGMNNSTQRKFRQFVLSRGFDSGFGLDLMVKDLTIALQVAKETGTPAPLAAQAREMWAAAAGVLGAGQDHTAMARFSETLAGVELASPQVERKG